MKSIQGQVKALNSEEIGDLLFAQLHPCHQKFFDSLYGSHNRIRLRFLPHYVFWRDQEYKRPRSSLYYKYLKESWRFYFPSDNTHKRRIEKIERYMALYGDIEKNGLTVPAEIVVAPDGSRLLVDGNHRASIAYKLGLALPYREVALQDYLHRIVLNKDEFYGTRNKDMPYQSVFYKDKELLPGRRRDVFERFHKMDVVNDIRGKDIADIGCNIAISSMLAWQYGAKSVVAMEYSPKIASSALRLSTLLDSQISVNVQDMGKRIPGLKGFDTVFCFSLDKHVQDKKGLEDNINKIAGRVLYLEGHERTSEEDYKNIFKYFRKVEQIGFNRDGVHSKKSTRPFFRCEK